MDLLGSIMGSMDKPPTASEREKKMKKGGRSTGLLCYLSYRAAPLRSATGKGRETSRSRAKAASKVPDRGKQCPSGQDVSG